MARTYGMVQTPALVAPTLPTPQQAGYSALGLGDTANFWDGSETYWQPTIEALDTVWNTYDTIPVHRNKYLPEDINLIAESQRSRYPSNDPDQHTEGDDYFSTFGFRPRSASSNDGIYLDVPFGQWEQKKKEYEDKMKTWNQLQGVLLPSEKNKYDHLKPQLPFADDRYDRPTIGITDSGNRKMQKQPTGNTQPGQTPPLGLPTQSVGMHELGGHYYDNVIAGQDKLSASDIMNSYMTDPMHQENWTQESLQKQWMSDPRTAHLDLNNPANTGLRTLLRNRSHHGGVVDPREGFGEYISTALTDPRYSSIWNGPGYSQSAKDYKMSNAEMFARSVGSTLRPQIEDEGFGISPNGLNKKFADSLATFLNSR